MSQLIDHEEQVRRAIRLLKPHKNLLEECKEEVEMTLGLWGFVGATWQQRYQLKPKQRKAAAIKFRAALKRMVTASKAFPAGNAIFDSGEDYDELLALAEKFVEKCDRIIEERFGPPRRSAEKKRWAAKEALHLLWRFAPDADVTLTIRNKLAAVLYGDLTADLRPHIREVCKKPGLK